MAFQLGVVDVVFGGRPLPEAAELARQLGFAHIDIPAEWSGPLGLPVGDRTAYPSPRPGCSCPAPPDEPGMWERTVGAYRKNPGARIEPWGGSVINTVEKVRSMLAEVPGLRLLVDTGHVANWGEDPVELLDQADHVQLRQATRSEMQTLEGDVDFRAVFRRLEQLDYAGKVSVEYFDLPEHGWPLADPISYAVSLRDQLRALG